MKRIITIAFVLLIVVGGWLIYKFPDNPHQVKSTSKPSKYCVNVQNPCYKISMADRSDLLLNSWQHYGESNCIIFTSLPDGDIHGYCSDYKITRLHY